MVPLGFLKKLFGSKEPSPGPVPTSQETPVQYKASELRFFMLVDQDAPITEDIPTYTATELDDRSDLFADIYPTVLSVEDFVDHLQHYRDSVQICDRKLEELDRVESWVNEQHEPFVGFVLHRTV